jgi:mono/diheme cytochrome c family protein
MLKKLVTFAGGLLLCSLVHANGKQLHDAGCLQCHASLGGGDAHQIYKRADKNIKSLAALEKRVSYCVKAADVSWNQQQQRAVVDYLNSTFYHF